MRLFQIEHWRVPVSRCSECPCVQNVNGPYWLCRALRVLVRIHVPEVNQGCPLPVMNDRERFEFGV